MCWRVLVVVLAVLVDRCPASPVDKPPQIVKKLDKQILLKFGPLNRFVLECVADAQPRATYQWFKNDQPLAADTAGILLVTGDTSSQLDFTSPGQDHAGYYYCLAENSLGRAKSTVVHVTSSPHVPPKSTRPPIFTKSPENEIPSVGSTVEFHCEADGLPEPTIVWTKNGERLPNETGRKLVIHNIGVVDVANYACNASNVAGYEYKDVYLNVLTVGAVITEGPRNQIVSKGSNVTMRCKSEGHPAPKVTWKVNGQAVTSGPKYGLNPATGELVVRQAEGEDQGEYECTATNHGQVRATARLTVKSKTEIIEGPSDQEATVFTSLKMPCAVVSDLSENLTVLWKKENIDLGQVGFPETERISQDENYSLFIKNLTFDDSGTYTCVASTATNLVTDSGLLRVVGIPPSFQRPTAAASTIPSLLEGADITLHCELAAGYPPPRIVWFKDGVAIDEDLVAVAGDTVTISAAQAALHSGDYTCRASNAWGSDTLEMGVQVRRRTQILSPAVSLEYAAGQPAVLDCAVDVDANLMGSLQVDWWKGEQQLDLLPSLEDFHVGEAVGRQPEFPLVSSSLVQLIGDEAAGDEEGLPRLVLLPNASLLISRLQQEDLGYYSCRVRTELEAVGLRSEVSQIYIPSAFPYWIIVLVICILLLLLLIGCLVIQVRRRTHGKGYYGVKDIEKTGTTPSKHNKSDIYYTTEDGDSVMNEQDNLPLNTSTPTTRTPIFTPKTIRHLANMDKATGSVGSLLEDDEFLRRGMDEDGSFRERYAD